MMMEDKKSNEGFWLFFILGLFFFGPGVILLCGGITNEFSQFSFIGGFLCFVPTGVVWAIANTLKEKPIFNFLVKG